MADPSTDRSTSNLRVLAGAIVVLVVVTSAAWFGVGRHETMVTGDDATAALLTAWERYRSGTFVVESEWSRTMTEDGRTLYSSVFLAQRPPDRVQRQHGSVRGQLNGNPIFCASEPDGDYGCRVADRAAPDHRGELEAELAAWRSYVAGSVPLYEIGWDGRNCFSLTLVRTEYANPPYGSSAEICFDADTGAMALLRRELDTAVEEQRAVAIRTDVGPADLSIEQDEDNVLPEFPTESTEAGEPAEANEESDVPG